ncbi:hypothetical protein [Pseudoxanthomonas putridarboris]
MNRASTDRHSPKGGAKPPFQATSPTSWPKRAIVYGWPAPCAQASVLNPSLHVHPMAKPNYSFEKRQRELAKKKKQDEKDAKKRAEREAARTDASPPAPEPE